MARVAIHPRGRAMRAKEAIRRLATPASAIRPAGIQLAVKRRNEVRGALATTTPPKAAGRRPTEAGALEHGANHFGRFGRERDARIHADAVRKLDHGRVP